TATVVAHVSYFAARERIYDSDVNRRWKDFVAPDLFVKALEHLRARGAKTVEFLIRAEIRMISGRTVGQHQMLTSKCVITLDQGLIEQLKTAGWASRSCHVEAQ